MIQSFFNWLLPVESKQAIFLITLSKISYSLIEPQLLPCTPACGYKFHALAFQLHPTFIAPPIEGVFGVQSNIYVSAIFLKKKPTC